MRLLPLLLLAACQQMEPTGNPLVPAPASPSSPRTAGAPTPSGGGEEAVGFDFEGDAGDEELDPDGVDLLGDDPAALLAAAQGLEAPPPAPEPPPEPVAPPPDPVPAFQAPPAMPVWDPATALPPDWGVRLVSTLPGVQPPRAVLGLSDGTEVVVQPGTFLPEHRLVVMAVGDNAVQVSRVVPEGYQARVETRTLASFFPSAAARAPAVP